MVIGTTQGSLYYTLDGSAPRLPGGGVNPAAQAFGTSANSIEDLVSEATDPMQILYPTTSWPGPTAWTFPDFDASDWRTGTNGVGYENTAAHYAERIHTPVGSPSKKPHSIYVRYPFTLQDPVTFVLLTLRVYYHDGFEYIELRNISAEQIDLSGMSFADGIEFTLPPPWTLDAGERIVLVENQAAFTLRYGTDPLIGGTISSDIHGTPGH